MQLGPFDRRKKRSRCQACAASHLKCSGERPCASCARRRVSCSYPKPREGACGPLILLERGRQQTSASWGSGQETQTAAETAPHVQAVAPPGRLAESQLRYVYFFDMFVRRNSFTGRSRTCGDEVKTLAELHPQQASHLHHATLALGALYAVRLRAADGPGGGNSGLLAALGYYSKALSDLRLALDARGRGKAEGGEQEQERTCILWTTLFLGLFELMSDATGVAWRQHMIHGTAQGLAASGPSACRSGPGLAFFTQARVLEVCRTILFNEATFLTEPGWVRLAREELPGDDGRPLDSLLDIMVMCSRLRVRAGTFIAGQDAASATEPGAEARAIASDGHHLGEALRCWHEAYADEASSSAVNDDGDDASMLLARVFFAATSIYLSGIFDYSAVHWQRLRPRPATLDAATVLRHVACILGLTASALERSRLSPLLFLFPLRIAGARSRGRQGQQQRQRRRIMDLLGRVGGGGFVVAAAVGAELREVWRTAAGDSDATAAGDSDATAASDSDATAATAKLTSTCEQGSAVQL
ncbi:Uncharacterized protein TCAP_01448 [Tolypocladium capitatum]|uniref:Zn(2)-C6 fungal-type domain-containing protein n=1 Tax=Tolypocladium capitatum TaxID=45235 RepID=A0A2K3QM77_9HYPO|nr:Uncharacterized protein TCAP_01448 [Tolypocladium capitatum]